MQSLLSKEKIGRETLESEGSTLRAVDHLRWLVFPQMPLVFGDDEGLLILETHVFFLFSLGLLPGGK